MSELPLADATLQSDVLCIACGYNLRGLDPSGRCPECGLAVADSNRGDRLAFADREWLRKLHFGTSLKLWNILIVILIGILSGVLVATMRMPQAVAIGIGAIGSVLGLWATFCITTQEPKDSLVEDPVTLRTVLRVCAVIALVVALLNELATLVFPAGAVLSGAGLTWIAASVIGGLAVLIVMVGELKYFRRFALRAQDIKLAKATRIVMWGLAITTGLTTIGSIFITAIVMPRMMAAAAAGTTATTSTTTGIGYTATVTETTITPSSGPGQPAPNAPGPAAPLVGGMSMMLGAASCVFMPIAGVFFLWYVSLLSRYKKLFKTAMADELSSG